jgi:hypothetical protein
MLMLQGNASPEHRLELRLEQLCFRGSRSAAKARAQGVLVALVDVRPVRDWQAVALPTYLGRTLRPIPRRRRCTIYAYNDIGLVTISRHGISHDLYTVKQVKQLIPEVETLSYSLTLAKVAAAQGQDRRSHHQTPGVAKAAAAAPL